MIDRLLTSLIDPLMWAWFRIDGVKTPRHLEPRRDW